MSKFKQHIPNYMSVDFIPEWVDFETTDDLLAFDSVEGWREFPGFSHFAVSENDLIENEGYLMAICNNGEKWWVVGYLKDAVSVNLPIWNK